MPDSGLTFTFFIGMRFRNHACKDADVDEESECKF